MLRGILADLRLALRFGAGLAAGLAGSSALTGLLASSLYGVKAPSEALRGE
jgi:hypothetical protein